MEHVFLRWERVFFHGVGARRVCPRGGDPDPDEVFRRRRRSYYCTGNFTWLGLTPSRSSLGGKGLFLVRRAEWGRISAIGTQHGCIAPRLAADFSRQGVECLGETFYVGNSQNEEKDPPHNTRYTGNTKPQPKWRRTVTISVANHSSNDNREQVTLIYDSNTSTYAAQSLSRVL